MKTGDYIYASILVFCFVIWFLALVFFVDKTYRKRKWRKLDEERYAYQRFVGVTDPSSNRSAERSK